MVIHINMLKNYISLLFIATVCNSGDWNSIRTCFQLGSWEALEVGSFGGRPWSSCYPWSLMVACGIFPVKPIFLSYRNRRPQTRGGLRRLNHSWNVGLGISAVLRDFIHEIGSCIKLFASPSVEPLKRRSPHHPVWGYWGLPWKVTFDVCSRRLGGLRMAIIALQKTSDVVNEMILLTNFSTVLMPVFIRFISS